MEGSPLKKKKTKSPTKKRESKGVEALDVAKQIPPMTPVIEAKDPITFPKPKTAQVEKKPINRSDSPMKQKIKRSESKSPSKKVKQP